MGSDPVEIPFEILTKLDAAQERQLRALIAGRPVSDHVIEYRASSSLFGQRFYVAFFAGREHRSRQWLAEHGQISSLRAIMFDFGIIAVGATAALIFAIGAFVVLAYLLKSGAGIDLFESHSALHDFFY